MGNRSNSKPPVPTNARVKIISRAVLVIDDLPIRQKLFSQTESLIKKIEKIERDKENFYKRDQRLFNDWYELTFREESRRHLELVNEYTVLGEFHNQIIAAAEMLGIAPARAYALLKDEEVRYAQGTPEQREKIDRLRREREAFAEAAMRAQFRSSAENFSRDPFGDAQDIDQDLFEVDLSSLTNYEREAYEGMKALSPEAIIQRLRAPQGAELLLEAFTILVKAQDLKLFEKIWELAEEPVRTEASHEFASRSGYSIEEFLDEIDSLRKNSRASRAKGKDSALDQDQSSDPSGQDANPDRRSGQSQKSAANRKKRTAGQGYEESDFADSYFQDLDTDEANLSADEQAQLKQSYRKLARMIHPDSQDPNLSETLKDWYAKTWLRVQEAYQQKNLSQLKRLEVLSLIRLRDLRSLTLGEISGSARWLQEELSEIKMNFRSLQKHPAWNFSRKKSYEKLRQRLQQEFLEELEPLIHDIEHIRRTHRYYASSTQQKSSRPARSQGQDSRSSSNSRRKARNSERSRR